MIPLFQNRSFSRFRMNWCAGSAVSPQTAENADSAAAMLFPRLSSAVNAEKTSTDPNGTTAARNPWYGAVLQDFIRQRPHSSAMPEPLKKMSSRPHASLPLTDSGKSGMVFRNRWSATSKGLLRKTNHARRKNSVNRKRCVSRSSSVWLNPGRITAMLFQSFRRYGNSRLNKQPEPP